jgi:hypothetical protein
VLCGLILGLALVGPGCVTNQPWVTNHETAPPAICQVHSFWDGSVQETQDVVNGGRPLRGLAGRVYIFSSELKPAEKGGDGTITVDLYDITNPQPGAQPKPLERWQLDPGNLSKVLRKDKIGWGYTLFLPWSTYSPTVARVQLNVCYTPAKGTPVYAQPTAITLRTQVTSTESRQLALPSAGSAVRQ